MIYRGRIRLKKLYLVLYSTTLEYDSTQVFSYVVGHPFVHLAQDAFEFLV